MFGRWRGGPGPRENLSRCGHPWWRDGGRRRGDLRVGRDGRGRQGHLRAWNLRVGRDGRGRQGHLRAWSGPLRRGWCLGLCQWCHRVKAAGAGTDRPRWGWDWIDPPCGGRCRADRQRCGRPRRGRSGQSLRACQPPQGARASDDEEGEARGYRERKLIQRGERHPGDGHRGRHGLPEVADLRIPGHAAGASRGQPPGDEQRQQGSEADHAGFNEGEEKLVIGEEVRRWQEGAEPAAEPRMLHDERQAGGEGPGP